MANKPILTIKSLKEQVYDYLRIQINKQKLKPGAAINMEATSKKLGISITPLRDALIQLEMEGFVTIAPRRGIYVNPLSLDDIRDCYQIIGALESSAIIQSSGKITSADIKRMEVLNREMVEALAKQNFDQFYKKNLEFHQTYIELCQNKVLGRIVNNLKKRLYDFPRRKRWIKEWEESSIKEHQKLVSLLQSGDIAGAAVYIHDVHWSFQVQEKFIKQYYSEPENR